jgi:membrane glycosyltransferase
MAGLDPAIQATSHCGRRMLARRAVFFAVLGLTAVGMTVLMATVLAPGGWTVPKLMLLLCFVGVAPWIGVCVGNALPGFFLLAFARDPARAVLPVVGDIETAPITARTAVAVTIRNEGMAAVLPPLRRLFQGLAEYRDRFALFVLSDTQDPALAAAEEAAIAAFPLPVRYRRRAANAGFKAGNVMDFLDHHADGFEFAVMLDADSEMSPAAVLLLVRIMQAAPRLGIVQHLTVGRPAAAAFPRLFQFGMRAGMRVWATGQAWWQGDEGPYWGHNAILRIAPFRRHCRLERLPDGSAILSHDQLEAARLRAAGWGVCVWAAEQGSLEANPPALPEFLHRDARWLAGNLQYRHLIRAPGLRPLGRWQLAQAVLLFAGAPLYTAMLALTAVSAATGGGVDFPRGRMLALTLAWTLAIYAPKLLGYAEVLLFRDRRARYGGGAAFAAGAAVEFAFTLLLDALSQPSKTLAMLRLALGSPPGWLPQNRSDRGVGWGEAARMFWPHTLFGLGVFALLAASSWLAALWALPFAGGLLVAIPFCVLTSDPRLSAALRRRRLAAIPEELP